MSGYRLAPAPPHLLVDCLRSGEARLKPCENVGQKEIAFVTGYMPESTVVSDD
jgi:hypothetical protein